MTLGSFPPRWIVIVWARLTELQAVQHILLSEVREANSRNVPKPQDCKRALTVFEIPSLIKLARHLGDVERCLNDRIRLVRSRKSHREELRIVKIRPVAEKC